MAKKKKEELDDGGKEEKEEKDIYIGLLERGRELGLNEQAMQNALKDSDSAKLLETQIKNVEDFLKKGKK